MAKDSRAVADSCKRLYGGATAESRAEVEAFLERHVPQSDRKELGDELKKTVPISGRQLKGKRKRVFRKTGAALQPARRRSGKLLTARERRRLGLNKLPRRGLKYADLLPMNALWLEYIGGLVDFSRPPQDEALKVRLCRADYHGAAVKVSRAANADAVGVEGLVAAETRNTLAVLGRDDVLRTVPKRGAAFTFRAGDHLFTVGGADMAMKPSERAVKKWKNKGPLNLW